MAPNKIEKLLRTCPARRQYSCGIIDVEMGNPTPVHYTVCEACLEQGGMTGGEKVRKQWVEARLTISEEKPRPGCTKCRGVHDFFRQYPLQVEKWQRAALDRGLVLAKDGLYKNGVLLPTRTMQELASHLGCPLPTADLEGVFDRVVVINLRRRADRMTSFWAQEVWKEWPFKTPERFEGVDGSLLPVPCGWTWGSGTWGCLQSHRHVLERAIQDGMDSVLVLEDDALFMSGFADGVRTFLSNVPAAWDGLYLGGQHLGLPLLAPKLVAPGVVRVVNPNRTHAYAVRGKYMRELYSELCDFEGHCDALMGPLAGKRHVYAPSTWLVAQAGGKSDISGAVDPTRLWGQMAPADRCVVVKTPPGMGYGLRLREVGGYTGQATDHTTGVDRLIVKAVKEGDPIERKRLFKEWWNRAAWESVVGSVKRTPCIWHPQIQGFESEIRDALHPVPVSSVEVNHLEGVTRGIIENGRAWNPTVDLRPAGCDGEQADRTGSSEARGSEG